MAEVTPLQLMIENLTEGALINRHAELLWIVIEEDWKDESRNRQLELLLKEIQTRMSAE